VHQLLSLPPISIRHIFSLPLFSLVLLKSGKMKLTFKVPKTCSLGPHSHRLLTIIEIQDLKQEKFVIDVEPSETVRFFPLPQLGGVIECGAHLFRFARSRSKSPRRKPNMTQSA
jgi:hypothetical protein